MRALVQRVTRASVSVDDDIVAAIDRPGLLVLLGVTHGDDRAAAASLAGKVWNLRVLHRERSAADVGAPLLVVSQFTLYADTSKGRRPSWSAAAGADVSEPLYEEFCQALGALGADVATGRFGAPMQVSLVNDGPMTLLVEA